MYSTVPEFDAIMPGVIANRDCVLGRIVLVSVVTGGDRNSKPFHKDGKAPSFYP